MPPSSSALEVGSGQYLQPVDWAEIREVFKSEHSLAAWGDALEKSGEYYSRLSPEATIAFDSYKVSAVDMARSMLKLAAIVKLGERQKLQTFLQKNYRLLGSVGDDQRGNVLVTAYYEPLLKGSLKPTKRYKYPIYRRPPDLLDIRLTPWIPTMDKRRIIARVDGDTLRPYFNREEIDLEKRLANKNLELAWVDDQLDLFFLQIQGSGRVQLTDGSMLRVGYHGANGHAYNSIGKILIEEGAISREDMSLPALRKWLKNNPTQQERILNANPSYVFFRKIDGGPYGNIDVALTPDRSIATDYHIFPKGAPGVLSTTTPRFADSKGDTVVDWQHSLRFVVNQDTGGAIRGAGRVDLFMGFGDGAERSAGIMKQSGSRLYFLAPIIPPTQKQ